LGQGKGLDSTTRENQRPRRLPRVAIVVLGITFAFWIITNHWIAEDRELFEFPHESALLATVLALIASIVFWRVGRIQLSKLCLGIGTAGLIVAVVLWWELWTNSFGG